METVPMETAMHDLTGGDGGEILFLCHRIPFPPDRGDKIRSWNLLKYMAQLAPVHVGCFADDERDMGFAGQMAEISASQRVEPRSRSKAVSALSGFLHGQPLLVAMYEKPALHRWVASVLATRPIRAIVGFSVQMAHYVPENLPAGTRFIMDFVDFDSAKYAAYGAEQKGAMGLVYRREGRLLHRYEQAVARRADASLFVSAAEADMFVSAGGVDGCRVGALENGVDPGYFSPDAAFDATDMSVAGPGAPLLVFTGQMDYRPNIDAVESFAKHALPVIRRHYPGATFAIVGRNPAPQVQALAQLPGIVVTGAVPDVRGWLAAADVVVAPLRIARGIQNKVLEAMAMGCAVMASRQAAEGIDAVPGTHLSVAADAEADADAEAQAVLDLLASPERRAEMGAAARRHVEERYDWASTLAPLRAMLMGERGAG